MDNATIRKVSLCTLLVTLFFTVLVSTAYSATIYPLEGQKSSYFPYTKEDEQRYLVIYECAYLATPEFVMEEWEANVQYNIDYFARLSEEDTVSFPGVFAVPDESAIPKEKVIFTAYAAMERLFGYTEDILIRFYPVCYYDVKDPENPVWFVDFRPVDLETLRQLHSFSVYVQAQDGLVLTIKDSSDAVG